MDKDRIDIGVTLLGNKLSPNLPELTAVDIAVHLGRIPRWKGATADWWSVLQHSLLVERILAERGCDAETRLRGLLHDAHEMFTGDIPRPYKGKEARNRQWVIDWDIARAFGLARNSYSDAPCVAGDSAAVDSADNAALVAELRVLQPTVEPWFGEDWFAGLIESVNEEELKFAEIWTREHASEAPKTWSRINPYSRMFEKRCDELRKALSGEEARLR